jgi:hypothetical protein
MKNNKRSKPSELICPYCDSNSVTVTEKQMFMVNSLEHYCNSVKSHDPNAEASCLDCQWQGIRSNLMLKV